MVGELNRESKLTPPADAKAGDIYNDATRELNNPADIQRAGTPPAPRRPVPSLEKKPPKPPAKTAPTLSPLDWAKLQDYSPQEAGKGLRVGTLCTVEVYLNGKTKVLGKTTNAALGAKPANHAERSWWENHSAGLVASVQQGCTAVLFHITRKPCAEGCDGWMKSTVYPEIKKAAGTREVTVLIKTYKDDDGLKHLYILTAGALTDQGTW